MDTIMAYSRPTASIITTCRGRLAHLQQTLPLMLGQRCSFAHEVVVVDYGCSQGTFEWCQSLDCSLLVAVRVRDGVEEFHRSRAKNCGAAEAIGQVFAFVDADRVRLLSHRCLHTAMSEQKLDHTPDQRSVLHILLHIQLGQAPAWFLSRSVCGGFDVLTGCGAGGIFLILFLVEAHGGETVALLSVIPLIALFLLVYIPFASKEHRARRRIRRQQEASDRELPEG